MPAKTTLWKVSDGGLKRVPPHTPPSEGTLENWVAADPSILGLDLMVVGRQVPTSFGGRIDLLGLDANGGLTVIELKRDRTPRDVIAQLLDYASWVSELTTREVHEIASKHLGKPLYASFSDRFGASIPDQLNTAHYMVLIAIEFDPSTQRIVEYLAEKHGVSINTAFFSYFREGDTEYLSADWLMDQDQVIERSEEKTQAPWSGFYYVNAGHDENHRHWEDMREFGFIAAGYGRFYSIRLNQLSIGDPIFVYQKGYGYIGYGIVTSSSVMAKDFVGGDGHKLKDLKLRGADILHDPDDPEMADYVVGVEWEKTFPLTEAQWLEGGFANQNVVCKLRHPATLEMLIKEFGVQQP